RPARRVALLADAAARRQPRHLPSRPVDHHASPARRRPTEKPRSHRLLPRALNSGNLKSGTVPKKGECSRTEHEGQLVLAVRVEEVVDGIERAFGGNEYPGDAWLQGSREGEEPFEECGAFVGQADWHALTPEFLDQHYVVLSFFSEAGFRFFMPAFLIADLRDQLRTADPVFHLVGGFSDFSVTHRVGDRDFVIRSGSTQFINPRRYGASRFIDYARHRLSVF